MSTDAHAVDAPGHDGAVDHHSTDDHGVDHGHDDHGHAEEPLGPIDVRAWGSAVLGLALGTVIAVCFALTTGALG